ncbi:MAG: SUMF1/EgtB/PvdO family nonheme iron enzyme [Lentimicrobiaceae bacterium]|jgi:gliding motility-associated lipoprotein GldK|nr:SUMF1/EgtB/PvdO family nonheme iron enzyme [Lentimicrobiaceae bacterium]MCP4911102.1 SUMF1/EgtB/PvdO family nonheme iron enzyme [Bacteroidota bacterium]MBT3454648.1 SUMF1/EgtB/PvdO family nonheme iron enzyme [Lentimicrobiaceae bacterium]MBT3819747.1 SUMF1/EgtB/PvdO family nonheme iron enzyme [Lentimicrobiaceae bacterium]MBT4061174.1 SUMF1/EgtB/PvdO family nonheme iron enzyme [Lentimicrobiaceae bacterium]
MKRLFIYTLAVLFLASCSNSGNGELVGTRKKSKPFYQPDPYGMVFVPMGSYTMGAGDEDLTHSYLTQPKTISVSAFFMDETEITNDKYRQFVHWVRDSIARTILGDVNPEEFLIEENPKTGEVYDPPYLNWKTDIDWSSEDQDVRDALEEMYLPEHERYFRRKEIDTRKLMYEYYWVDLHAAAKKDFSEDADYRNAGLANRPQGLRDRSVYVRKETIAVYPDTLSWIHDYTYSFNDPLTQKYFWHPAYDNYPVVGVNWKQARAFSVWRTELLNASMRSKKGGVDLAEFRLPTEAEWEWAARGGYTLNPYPWGGPYTRNEKGCFLANFKPLRGNYIADGGIRTVICAHYPPNDWGLYDMSGNVAEWTNSAFDPASYNFTWDMNPNYTYNAKEDDPPVMKRKVIRGGSWKDIAYYLQVTTRSYEYQDTAKSYIGFRCVQPYLGRNKGDNPNKASRVYN